MGIGETLPLIGYVFSEKWGKNNPNTLQGFLDASNEARQILKNSDQEWERIKKITIYFNFYRDIVLWYLIF